MEAIYRVSQAIFACVGGVVGWLLGGLDGPIYALIIFVVIDYATGLVKAVIHKNLSSEIGFKGIWRKVLIFLVVCIAHTIDFHLIGEGGIVRTAVIFFYLSNEGISILENAAQSGLPVPEKLKEILAQLQTKKEDKE